MPNITKAFVRAAKCEEGKSKQEFYDDSLKGFVLEVRVNGRKTFYMKLISTDGSRKSIKIADATLLDADSARLKAIKLKRSMEEGKDVILDVPEEETLAPTLREFFEEQYMPFVKHYSKSWDKNASTYLIHILPDLGNYPMDKITPPMIAKCHVAMVEKKKLSNSSANKYVIFLRHAYNLAIEWKLNAITDNPATKVKL